MDGWMVFVLSNKIFRISEIASSNRPGNGLVVFLV